MPKAPRWTAAEAEAALLRAGFVWVRTKGSHRVYMKGVRRVVVPFHSQTILHQKTIRQVMDAIEETK